MGTMPDRAVGKGECMKIATGGALPEGADAVVMFEQSQRVDDRTIEVVKAVAPDENVSTTGEDMKKGEAVFRAGHVVRPKRHDVPQPPRARLLPEWLERTDVPVPALPEFREQSLSTRVYAFIMAMIDGRRSIEDMAALMLEQRLMTKADAVPAIRQFLARMQADAKRRADF